MRTLYCHCTSYLIIKYRRGEDSMHKNHFCVLTFPHGEDERDLKIPHVWASQLMWNQPVTSRITVFGHPVYSKYWCAGHCSQLLTWYWWLILSEVRCIALKQHFNWHMKCFTQLRLLCFYIFFPIKNTFSSVKCLLCKMAIFLRRRQMTSGYLKLKLIVT